MNCRIAGEQDIPVMCQIRKQQLIDEGIAPDRNIGEELTQYFEKKLADHSLVEWLLEDHGSVAATAAIAFFEFPPSYTNPSGVKGYITNMYTAPQYRGKGIASEMLEKLKEEAKIRGVQEIWLISSVYGRSVYKRSGFIEEDNYMRIKL